MKVKKNIKKILASFLALLRKWRLRKKMVFLQKKLSIPSLMPLSTIISISISVNNSNFTSVFFARHANAGAERSFTESK